MDDSPTCPKTTNQADVSLSRCHTTTIDAKQNTQKHENKDNIHSVKAISVDNLSLPSSNASSVVLGDSNNNNQRRHSSTSHVIKSQMKVVIGSLEGILRELRSVVVDLKDVVVQIDDVTNQIEDTTTTQQKTTTHPTTSLYDGAKRPSDMFGSLEQYDIPNSIDSGLADINSISGSVLQKRKNTMKLDQCSSNQCYSDGGLWSDNELLLPNYRKNNNLSSITKSSASNRQKKKNIRRQSFDVMENLQCSTDKYSYSCKVVGGKTGLRTHTLSSTSSVLSGPKRISGNVKDSVNINNNDDVSSKNGTQTERNSNAYQMSSTNPKPCNPHGDHESDYYERQLEQMLEDIGENQTNSDLYSHSGGHYHGGTFDHVCTRDMRRKSFSDTLFSHTRFHEDYNNYDSDDVVSDDGGSSESNTGLRDEGRDIVMKSSDTFRFKVKQLGMTGKMMGSWRVVIDP